MVGVVVWAVESVLSLATSAALFRFVNEPFLEGGSRAEILGELAAVEESEAGAAETAGRMSCGWGLSSIGDESIVEGRGADAVVDDERGCQ